MSASLLLGGAGLATSIGVHLAAPTGTWRECLGPPATFNKDTGAGYLSPKEGDYARATRLGAERGRR